MLVLEKKRNGQRDCTRLSPLPFPEAQSLPSPSLHSILSLACAFPIQTRANVRIEASSYRLKTCLPADPKCVSSNYLRCVYRRIQRHQASQPVHVQFIEFMSLQIPCIMYVKYADDSGGMFQNRIVVVYKLTLSSFIPVHCLE